MNKLIYILFLMLNVLAMNAQTADSLKDRITQNISPVQTPPSEPAMADAFRSEGKIYVVIAVLVIIFLCLIAYMIYLDIKLKKLEKKSNEK